jgi:uncharacterized membrane protein/protein-disulfide isomerase
MKIWITPALNLITFMLSSKKTSNPAAVIYKLLKFSGIYLDQEQINIELDKHPDFPSLLAISDVLNAFKIENNGFKIAFEDLNEMEFPFITHSIGKGGEFLVITKIKDGKVYYANEKPTIQKISLDKFKSLFSGVVLYVEPKSIETIKPDKLTHYFSVLKYPLLFAISILLIGFTLVFNTSFTINLTWQVVVLLIFKTVGLITSILLLIQSIDGNNPLVQVLCGGDQDQNCNAILTSKAAKVPIKFGKNGLSWSEVGFVYFAGTWLLLLFGGNNPLKWQALIFLNIISLPYTFYSIYFQAFIAKQWCRLCTTVQIVLWLEFFSLILYNHHNVGINTFLTVANFNNASAATALLTCLVSPILFWALLKPLLLQVQLIDPLKNQLHQFKYNTELFNKLLTSKAKIVQPAAEWSVVLGNPEANQVITMVTNPYCQPCAKAHQLLDELLQMQPGVQARIVFTADNTDNDVKTPVSRHLMALNTLADKTIVEKALHSWYAQEQKNYNDWAKAYPTANNIDVFDRMEKQKEWYKMAEVTATPTILLNGYPLPDFYQLPDLKYMLLEA